MSKNRFELITEVYQETAGQSLIETALLGSLFVVLLLGVGELGRVAYASIEVANAARAGAAYGMQNGATASDSTGIATAAANDAANLTGLTTTSSTSCVCSDGTSSTCAIGDCSASHIEEIVTVNTSVTFSPVIHLPGLPTSYTLHGKAVQKCMQ
ncbi:MAG: pilus assembly protein [Silvibacterium sp.]|nr:pilus assembly protein [Silvibacterium sp.]